MVICSGGGRFFLMLSGQTFLVTPWLSCSFPANYHLNYLRPAPTWHCSSVGRAMVVCFGGRGFESHRALFLSRAIPQKESFVIFIQHFKYKYSLETFLWGCVRLEKKHNCVVTLTSCFTYFVNHTFHSKPTSHLRNHPPLTPILPRLAPLFNF